MTSRFVALLAGLVACSPPVKQPTHQGSTSFPQLIAATAADDYSAAALSLYTPPQSALDDITSLFGDSTVKRAGNVIYALERLGADAIRRYDKLDGSQPTWQVSVDQGSNPQSIVDIEGSLLVTRLEMPSALILDAQTGQETATLDLSDYADSDGIPEMADLVAVGSLALVGLQRLDRDHAWKPNAHGMVAVVDVAEVEVRSTFNVGPNPVLIPHDQDHALVLTPLGLTLIDADGIVAGPHLPTALAGQIVDASVADDGRVAAIIRHDDNTHQVICLDTWDASAFTASPPVANYLSDILIDDETIWIAARRGWADARVAGGLIAIPLDDCTAMPPQDAWIRGTYAPYALALAPKLTP